MLPPFLTRCCYYARRFRYAMLMMFSFRFDFYLLSPIRFFAAFPLIDAAAC